MLPQATSCSKSFIPHFISSLAPFMLPGLHCDGCGGGEGRAVGEGRKARVSGASLRARITGGGCTELTGLTPLCFGLFL
ncbi:hypothetical protein Tco_0549952 [Tanacetum coccineum]